MIVLLTGDNEYAARQEVARLASESGTAPEYPDVSVLDANALADIMRGASLFSEQRLIVMRNASSRSDVWQLIGDWAGDVSDDTTLVLREIKPDKRTRTYKTLVSVGKLVEATSWTERQTGLAEKWTRDEAKKRSMTLSVGQVRDIVVRSLVAGERSGGRTVDQALITQALDALASAESITDEMIATVLPAPVSDAVFDLLDIATRHEGERLRRQLDDLRTLQDGYQVFAVVVSQWTQLVLLTVGTDQDIAGIHPYVRQKLSALTHQFDRRALGELTRQLVKLDAQTKSSSADPWDALELFLFGIVHR